MTEQLIGVYNKYKSIVNSKIKSEAHSIQSVFLLASGRVNDTNKKPGLSVEDLKRKKNMK